MAAFRFADPDTGEITETDDVMAFWMFVREKAARDVQAWHKARLAALAERVPLAQSKGDLEYAEAMLRQSDAVTSGKNAEERKAILDRMTHEDQYFQDLNARVKASEQKIGALEADAEAAHNRYRVSLRDLEVLAAIYGPQERRA